MNTVGQCRDFCAEEPGSWAATDDTRQWILVKKTRSSVRLSVGGKGLSSPWQYRMYCKYCSPKLTRP